MQFVVDPEADTDGDGDDAGGGHDEQHTHLQDGGEQQSEDEDTDAGSEEAHGGAADVVHGADGIGDILGLHLTLEPLDVVDGHAAGEQRHALLGAETFLIHFGIDSEATEAEDHEAAGDGDDEGREKDGRHERLRGAFPLLRHFAGEMLLLAALDWRGAAEFQRSK